MQFVSLSFLIFVFGTIFVYYLIPKKIRYVWLLLASLLFYFEVSRQFLVLLIIISLITYGAGLFISGKRKDGAAASKICLIISIVVLAGTLGFFKYTGFLLDTVDSVRVFFGREAVEKVFDIIVPVGISFYIFQAIGYIADCYKGVITAEKNPAKVMLFISFFPQITSGPIERAGNMIPQYSEPKSFDYDRMRDALLLILWGYFQKIILADRLAVIVNTIYSSYEQYPSTILFMGTVFYTMEIYCDFAGYSNIAIGIAKVMGIDIMENFTQPYLSCSISEFWRRWHISLSSWLRDYIYIPLGGNRKGKARKIINLLIVFAISGLWHGAAWTFVIWGLLHGLYQVFGIILKPARDKIKEIFKVDENSFSHKLLCIIVTFMLVNIGWVFFRAPHFEGAIYILKNMWKPSLWVLTDKSLYNLGLSEPDVRLMFAGLLLLLAVDILNYRGIYLREFITRQSLWLRWIIYIAAVVFVVTCGIWGPGYDASTFIYSSF